MEMLKGTSLSAKLYMGFGTVLLIVAALGLFAYVQLAGIKQDAKNMTGEAIPGILYSQGLQMLVQENVSLVLRHVVAPDVKEKTQIEAEMADMGKKIDKMMEDYKETISDPKEQELFAAIGPAREKFIAARNEAVLPPSRSGKLNEAMAAFTGRLVPAYQTYIDAAEKCVDFNKEDGDRFGKEISTSVSLATTGIIIGLLLALAVGSAIGIFLSRSISSALQKVIASLSEGSEQVSSASGQVSQSSQQMAEGASEQASSLEETSASLEEMSSMTKQNSDNAKQANVMANDTRQAVEKSRTAMTRMSEAIGQIKNSSDQTAKIVKTIDEIAFQTNLLALNAAVEAARAGDAGKGFAVVAEEVRNLAQRSAEAAKNTSSLIEQSQKNADNGVAVSQEVATILTQIVESVQKLSQLIGEVSSASMEQAKGIEQIGTAVTQMDKLTQSNAANAEESASASEELSAQANELNDMVNVLVGIVTGSTEGGARPARSPAVSGKKPGRAESHKAPEHKQKPAAKSSAPKAQAKHDWAAVPNGRAKNGFSNNGRATVLAGGGHPEEVIPLGDDELKDF
ncbi:MAG: methyl-accepting chemotaxis sensory transducer [Fibrobacteres bacterium]|nr:methyl-accepting chemotaxis sensory transducer [Fibrobacterota bacterium]